MEQPPEKPAEHVEQIVKLLVEALRRDSSLAGEQQHAGVFRRCVDFGTLDEIVAVLAALHGKMQVEHPEAAQMMEQEIQDVISYYNEHKQTLPVPVHFCQDVLAIFDNLALQYTRAQEHERENARLVQQGALLQKEVKDAEARLQEVAREIADKEAYVQKLSTQALQVQNKEKALAALEKQLRDKQQELTKTHAEHESTTANVKKLNNKQQKLQNQNSILLEQTQSLEAVALEKQVSTKRFEEMTEVLSNCVQQLETVMEVAPNPLPGVPGPA